MGAVTLRDDLNRMLADALRESGAGEVAEQYHVAYDLTPLITVQRATGYVPMSIELLLDAGLITEEQARAQGWTPYVPPPVPWSSRLRWRWQAWRERAGRKIGGWIAGVDLSERDEDW